MIGEGIMWFDYIGCMYIVGFFNIFCGYRYWLFWCYERWCIFGILWYNVKFVKFNIGNMCNMVVFILKLVDGYG